MNIYLLDEGQLARCRQARRPGHALQHPGADRLRSADRAEPDAACPVHPRADCQHDHRMAGHLGGSRIHLQVRRPLDDAGVLRRTDR